MHRLLLVLCLPAFSFGQNLAGEWEFTVTRFHAQNMYNRVTLSDQLTGKMFGMELQGSLKGSAVEFRLKDDGKDWGSFTGSVSNGEMHGQGHIIEGNETFDWRARRPLVASGAPKTHKFVPEKFHNYFSSTIPPALHISPGDTVETKSVDAG